MKKYIIRRKNEIFLIVTFSLIASFFGVVVQFLKGRILDIAIYGNSENMLFMIVILLTAILSEMILFYMYDCYSAKYSIGIGEELRNNFFDSLFCLRVMGFKSRKESEYVAEYTNRIDTINSYYFSIIPLLIEIVGKILIVSISLFILDYRIAILTLFLLTTPLYVPKIIEKRLKTSQQKKIEMFEKHLTKVVEWLSGFELITMFSIFGVIKDYYQQSLEEVSSSAFTAKKLSALSRLLSGLLSYLSHFIILTVAAILVSKKQFTAGEFFIAVGMIDQLSYPIISLSMYLKEIISTKSIAEDFVKGIENRNVIEGQCERFDLIDRVTNVDFKDVSFSYNESKLIENFSLSVKAGEKCLIMGESGSGKSTLMDMLMGYYSPTKGEVLINGSDVSKVRNINQYISIMRQEAFLFEDSLRNNLTMFRDILDEELISVLKKVKLDKFADKESLDMCISLNGENLSGGEKKRVALARVLLSDTPIIILDEPLANVDTETVNRIEDAIVEFQGKTIFVVSHFFSKEKRYIFDREVGLS